MLVTRETDYAVRCALYLAGTDAEVTSVAEIAVHTQVPKIFLAKILQRMMRAGIVKSLRGTKGGFCLAKPPAAITLLDIVRGIQQSTGINLCAVHPVWIDIRTGVENRLQQINLEYLRQQDGKLNKTCP